MNEDSVRNDIPWAEDARDACLDSHDLAVATAGTIAHDGTHVGMTSAGIFSAGAGLGFAISGAEPAAAGAEILADGLLNPYVQEPIALGAAASAEHYVDHHWGPTCDAVADGIDASADGALAVAQFMEHAPAPSYVDAKLGYDPYTQSPPNFESTSESTHPADTTAAAPAISTFDWPTWGMSDLGASAAPPAEHSSSWLGEPAPDSSAHGVADSPSSWNWGGASDNTSDTGTAAHGSGDTWTSSLFGGTSSDSSSTGSSWGLSWGSSSDSSGSTGSSDWGGSSSSSHDWGGGGSSSHDWGGGSSMDSGSSSSSGHESGPTSMDGGI